MLTNTRGFIHQLNMADEFNRKFIKRAEDFEDKDLSIKDPDKTKESLIEKGFIEKSLDKKSICLGKVFIYKNVDDLTDNEFLYLNKIMAKMDKETLC